MNNKNLLSIFMWQGRLFFLILTLFQILLNTNTIKAQKQSDIIENGDNAFSDNNYFSASLYYNQAILQDSTNILLQYKYAEASRLNFDYIVANHWYQKVLKVDIKGELFPECAFWLATTKKNAGNYKDSKKLFDKYIKKNKKKKNNYFILKATQELAACDYSSLLIASEDKSITIIHLDTLVNSTVSEYAPIQLDSVLYFSSLRNESNKDEKHNINYNKIYSATQGSVSWQKAIELDSSFNKNGIHNANTAFNTDKTKVYITRCEQKNARDFNCEIYFSAYKSGFWSNIQKLPPEINMEGFTNTQPAIGYLGKEEVLFFSSNRPGGEGNMDIWYCKLNNDGSYGKAINAGKKINSIEDEITPYYCNPCQELFFSSTWHKGLGGFDIFKSNFKDEGFGEANNLGLPINTSYNDIYFSISSTRKSAFISSNRPGSLFEGKESCCNDIYMFNIPVAPEIKVIPKKVDSTQIFVAQMKQLLPLTLYFHNDEPDKKTLAITTTRNYKKTYEDYYAMRELYISEYSKGAKDAKLLRAINDIDILFEDSIDAGMRDLELFSQLLVKVLKSGEKVTIILKGYCSPLASSDYNINLAKRRISSLQNYFMEYQNGVFLSFINKTDNSSASITFINEDIGELKARANVSDDYYDKKNSIYNPTAAIERKIQIIDFGSVSSTSSAIINATTSLNTPNELNNLIEADIKQITTEENRKQNGRDINQTKLSKDLLLNKANNKTETIPAVSKKGNFVVQVRGHSHLLNAQTTEIILKKNITQPVIILNEGGLFKVRIQGFNSYEEAKSIFPKLIEMGFVDAFVVLPKK